MENERKKIGKRLYIIGISGNAVAAAVAIFVSIIGLHSFNLIECIWIVLVIIFIISFISQILLYKHILFTEQYEPKQAREDVLQELPPQDLPEG